MYQLLNDRQKREKCMEYTQTHTCVCDIVNLDNEGRCLSLLLEENFTLRIWSPAQQITIALPNSQDC